MKYTLRWFRKLTDEELEAEREIVRQKHCRGENVWDLLQAFDREMNRRYAEKHKDDPPRPVRHREHG